MKFLDIFGNPILGYSYEIKKEKRQTHYTEVMIGDVAAFKEHKRQVAARMAVAEEQKRQAWVIKRARIAAAIQLELQKFFSGDTTPVNICECGSAKIGSDSHSSWCPAYASMATARNKTSNNNVKE